MYLLVHRITDTNRISVISNPRRHNVTATVRSICPPMADQTHVVRCNITSSHLIDVRMLPISPCISLFPMFSYSYSRERYLRLTRDTNVILDPCMTSAVGACRTNWIACSLLPPQFWHKGLNADEYLFLPLDH